MSFHGRRASTPLGPAAGPQSQMAQNIVLCWLSGSRVMELKTVQVLDELPIPRPCIDMATVGYNVEWSQELKLQQSLEEYVKGSMLVEILQASGKLPLSEGFDDLIFDMSVGYDLAGIRSPAVRAFTEPGGARVHRGHAERHGYRRAAARPDPGRARQLPGPAAHNDAATALLVLFENRRDANLPGSQTVVRGSGFGSRCNTLLRAFVPR